MEAYKEGFSAVGFKCINQNVLTGEVNRQDAVDIIKELTRDGCQVGNKFLLINTFEHYFNQRENDMLAFAMCSHGLAETSDGQLRVAFSDQMISLETLLEENMKFKKMFYS